MKWMDHSDRITLMASLWAAIATLSIRTEMEKYAAQCSSLPVRSDDLYSPWCRNPFLQRAILRFKTMTIHIVREFDFYYSTNSHISNSQWLNGWPFFGIIHFEVTLLWVGRDAPTLSLFSLSLPRRGQHLHEVHPSMHQKPPNLSTRTKQLVPKCQVPQYYSENRVTTKKKHYTQQDYIRKLPTQRPQITAS